ncbi:MAG: hypothetical protein FJZ63_00435, partial [Chlamydiae bacterium]|nr:hypothetical protein [Chlamydiota bacterium]
MESVSRQVLSQPELAKEVLGTQEKKARMVWTEPMQEALTLLHEENPARSWEDVAQDMDRLFGGGIAETICSSQWTSLERKKMMEAGEPPKRRYWGKDMRDKLQELVDMKKTWSNIAKEMGETFGGSFDKGTCYKQWSIFNKKKLKKQTKAEKWRRDKEVASPIVWRREMGRRLEQLHEKEFDSIGWEGIAYVMNAAFQMEGFTARICEERYFKMKHKREGVKGKKYCHWGKDKLDKLQELVDMKKTWSNIAKKMEETFGGSFSKGTCHKQWSIFNKKKLKEQ